MWYCRRRSSGQSELVNGIVMLRQLYIAKYAFLEILPFKLHTQVYKLYHKLNCRSYEVKCVHYFMFVQFQSIQVYCLSSPLVSEEKSLLFSR